MIYIENKNQNNEIRFPKSLSNGAPAAYLYLENHLGNYTMNVVDTSNYSNYYVFSLNLSTVQDGEYYAYLQDASKNVLAQTIMYVGVSDDDEIDYEYYEEPEVDVEFDPNLILINPYDVEIIDIYNIVTYYHFEDGIVPDEYFSDNQEIVSVRFGESIWKVGNTAFGGCRNLSRIDWGGVTNIGDYAFAWGYSLTSLTIPSTIEYIGEGAFEINNLLSLTFEDGYDGVSAENGGVFADNYNLTSVTFSNTQTSIGDYDFSACESLVHVTVPDSVTRIGDGAFGYTALENISIGSELTEVGNAAFGGCNNLTAITITATVAPTLGSEPFEDVAEIGLLTYPEGSDYSEWYEWLPYGWNPDAVISHFYFDDGSVKEYGSMETFDRTFYGVDDIVRIEFGEGLEEFENSTINELSNLTSVTFPSTLASIADDNFKKCSSLTQITCNATVAPTLGDDVFVDIAEEGTLVIPNGSDYSSWYEVLPIGWNPNLKTMLLHYQDGTTQSVKTLNPVIDDTYSDDANLIAVEIGEGFTTLDDYAFESCPNLSSVTLPNGLTSIGKDAFYECSSLTNMFIPNSVTEINDYAFYNCFGLTSINIPTGLTSINQGVFYGCENLTNITIPDNVTIINQSAFYGCYNIQQLNISKNSKLTKIDHLAFLGNELIENLNLPSGITYIGQWAFSYCKSLTAITCSATTVPTLDEGAFADIAEEGVLTYPSGSDYSTFYNALPEGWRPVVVVGTVKVYFQNGTDRTDEYNSSTLQTDIYSGDTTITKVEISTGITAIGQHIFDGCQNITSITLQNGLTSIGVYAFNDCNNITGLTLPNSLINIGESAFGNCTKIYGSLTIPDNVTYIGNDAFYNCNGLTDLVFGQNSNCTSIGIGAFQSCYELGHIYLPASLQSIGNGAFSMCAELINITCSATTAPTLGDSVFYGVGTASINKGTLTYPSGANYSSWYAQLPEKFDPNYNPGGGGNIPGPGGDEFD